MDAADSDQSISLRTMTFITAQIFSLVAYHFACTHDRASPVTYLLSFVDSTFTSATKFPNPPFCLIIGFRAVAGSTSFATEGGVATALSIHLILGICKGFVGESQRLFEEIGAETSVVRSGRSLIHSPIHGSRETKVSGVIYFLFEDLIMIVGEHLVKVLVIHVTVLAAS